jgi:hypothetical protein
MSICFQLTVSLLLATFICEVAHVRAVPALIKQPLQTYRDKYFAVSVGLGTPAQPLLLRADVTEGSWVAAANCTYCCVSKKFNASASTTGGQIVSSDPYTIVETATLYGADPKTALAVLDSWDTNVIYTAGRSPDNALPFDGVVNLAEVADKALAAKMTSASIYSIFIKQTCANGVVTSGAGQIVYGGTDDTNCKAVTEYFKDPKTTFVVPLDSITIGNSAPMTLTSQEVVIYPFGTTTILSQDAYDAIVKAWNVEGSGANQTVNCAPSPVPGPLTFTIKGKPYALPYSHFVRNTNGVCQLHILPNTVSADLPADFFSIGIGNAYCTVVDVANSQFGLAPLQVAETDACTYEPADGKTTQCSGDPAMTTTTPKASGTIGSCVGLVLTALAFAIFTRE